MAVDWEKDCKDTMWAMFWVGRGSSPAARAQDAEALKANVARLIRMTTQKTAGQRGKAGDIDWDSLTPTLMNIAISATAMCLDGAFGEMPKEVEE